MMKHEFEALAGYEVSTADYDNIIEPMYMATNLSKADFVQTINRKRFEVKKVTERQLVNMLKKDAQHLADICGHCLDYEAEKRMEANARQIAKMHGYDFNDFGSSYFFEKEYEYPNMRGCSFPKTLVIYISGKEVKRINLVK